MAVAGAGGGGGAGGAFDVTMVEGQGCSPGAATGVIGTRAS